MKIKRLVACILTILLAVTMTGGSFVFADSGYDNTAPRIKSIEIQNPEKIGTSEHMTASLDFVEDGVGIKDISRTDATPPVIRSVRLGISELKTPGLLPIEFDCIEDGEGINSITFNLMNTQTGQVKQLRWDGKDSFGSTCNALFNTGSHTLELPVGPFWRQGTYLLNGICVKDKAQNTTFYSEDDSLFSRQTQGRSVTLNNNFDIAYYGSLGNAKAIEGVKNLKDGETAVLDCRMAFRAKKALFSAIAGRDRTIVFEDDNVQWVFNGKDIKASQCKDIKVSSTVQIVDGAAQGYPDERKIVKIIFPSNGTLPGTADIRVNNAYITKKYAGSNKDLVVSYVEKGSPVIEAEDVECAEDNFAEFDLDHNSTFLISQTKAKLVAPSSVKASSTPSSVKLSWDKVPAAKGYKIYRADSENGSYKLAGNVIGNQMTKWQDPKLKANKRYYYKVKAYGSDKSMKAQFSTTVWGRTAPPKQSIVLKTSKRTVRVLWKRDYQRASGYQIVYAGNKKFKRGKWIWIRDRYRNQYNIKNLKTGKNYYVKARSYKNLSGKTVYGIYSDVKKIKVK